MVLGRGHKAEHGPLGSAQLICDRLQAVHYCAALQQACAACKRAIARAKLT